MIKKTLQLNTDLTIPNIGFGTWEITPDASAEAAVSNALKAGYRLIDTARIYGNERGVGEAISKSLLQREQLFVATKLWNDDQGYDRSFKAFDKSLEKLKLDYLDLYLIHWPATSKRHESWRALEELHKSGRAKAIGVCNYTVEHLQDLLERSRTVPAINQVEFHPFIFKQQKPLLDFCQEQGIQLEAYSPLSRISNEKHEPIEQLAKDYDKSPQQLILRWCLQHGTLPLPRSVTPAHIKSNLDIYDFEISEEDMSILNSLSDGERVTWDPEGMG